MRNYIILNGKNSNQINGLLIQELPPISKPLIRTETEEIDGRDGDIVTPLGYSSYDKEFTIGLYKDFDVNEVAAYFNSEGTVIFSNEPDKYYYYQITAQIDFERLVRYRTATVTMHCQPFKYSATEQPITEDVSGTVSDEGTNLALENTAEAPFNTLNLKGNTEQDGTPTPDASVPVQTVTGENVVEITGRNLFDSSATPDYVAQQAWAYFGNGTYTAVTNGYYFESGYRAIAFEFDSLTVGQQYTLSFDAEGNSSHNAQVGVNMYSGASGGTQKNYTIETTSARISFTFTATSANRIAFNSGSTSGADLTITNIQLELGSTATAYEPYQGQSYEVNLDIGGGKNLLKYSWPYTTGYYDGRGAWSTDARFACYDKYFEVEPNTTYSFSSSHSNTNMAILWFDENKNWISRTATTSATSASGTSPATAKYARLQVRYETNTPISYWLLGSMALQFEQGSVSSYEPFVCYELCKIGDYQDYIYKSGGKWYVHKAVGKLIYNGTETWNSWYNVGDCIGFYIYSADDAAVIGVESAINNALWCDKFSEATTRYDIVSGSTEGIKQCGGGGRQYIALGIEKSRLSDYSSKANAITSLGTWLSNNPTTTYYALATPTDIEITNEALIAQLDDIYYHAHAYKGRTHITSSAATGNVPHIIAAEVGEDNESTITNAGNYLSKPKITVYGSGDISLYINDMHVLQITLGDEGYITIDTAQMEAYKDTLDNLKNRLVIGDYSNARLKPGANKIHFTGTVTKYVVENYSRWL